MEQKKPEDAKPEDAKPENGTAVPDGAGPAVAPPQPKPVEVMSVPETPVNGTTPAGGTPRPELNLAEPEKPDVEEQPTVVTGVLEPEPTPVTSLSRDETVAEPIIDAGGPNGVDSKDVEMAGALQPDKVADTIETGSAKRKLDAEETNGSSASSAINGEDRADKKAKTETAPETNGGSTAKKASRPKKEKKPAPPVGRTARKTRSQGNVDV